MFPPRSNDAARASPDGAAGARARAVRRRGLEQGEVRAEAIASGISLGTELALYRGASPFASKRFDVDLRLFVDDSSAAFPARLGYEWVGVVSESSVGELRAGERIHVTLPHRETQTFAADGPTHCSGLPVRRHTADDLAGTFSGAFTLQSNEREEHVTPAGGTQPFTWAVLRRD
jgi:threonine dehydrogenase-like Zn-dependent dehydrogenase